MITFTDLKETIVKYHRLIISSTFEWKTSSDNELEEVEDSLYALLNFETLYVKNEDGTKEGLMGWRLKLLHGTIGICSFHPFTKPWFYERTMIIKCFVLTLLEHNLCKSAFALMLEHMKSPNCVVDIILKDNNITRVSSFLFDLISYCVERGFATPLGNIINYEWEGVFKQNESLTDNVSISSFGVQSWLFFNIETLINCASENNHTECTAILLRWKKNNVLLQGGDMEL